MLLMSHGCSRLLGPFIKLSMWCISYLVSYAGNNGHCKAFNNIDVLCYFVYSWYSNRSMNLSIGWAEKKWILRRHKMGFDYSSDKMANVDTAPVTCESSFIKSHAQHWEKLHISSCVLHDFALPMTRNRNVQSGPF